MIVNQSLFDPRCAGDANPRSMDVGGDFRRLVRAMGAPGEPPEALREELRAVCAKISEGLPEDTADDELSVRQVVRRMARALAEAPEGDLFEDDLVTWLRTFPIGAGNTPEESVEFEIHWLLHIAPEVQTQLGECASMAMRTVASLVRRVVAAIHEGEPSAVRVLRSALGAMVTYRPMGVTVRMGIDAPGLPNMKFVQFSVRDGDPQTRLGLSFLNAAGEMHILDLGADSAKTIEFTPQGQRLSDQSTIFRQALDDYRTSFWSADAAESASPAITAAALQDLGAYSGLGSEALAEEVAALSEPRDVRPFQPLGERWPPFQDGVRRALGSSRVIPLRKGGEDSLAADLAMLGLSPDALDEKPPASQVLRGNTTLAAHFDDANSVSTPSVTTLAGAPAALSQRAMVAALVRALGLSAKDFLDRILKNPIVISNPAEYGELLLEWAALPGEVNILEAVVIAGGLGYELADLAKYLEGELSLDAMVELLKTQEARRARTVPAR